MRTGLILIVVAVAALAASSVGYAAGSSAFGTAAGVTALTTVGAGLATVNDHDRSGPPNSRTYRRNSAVDGFC
jgi:hypothetical protein